MDHHYWFVHWSSYIVCMTDSSEKVWNMWRLRTCFERQKVLLPLPWLRYDYIKQCSFVYSVWVFVTVISAYCCSKLLLWYIKYQLSINFLSAKLIISICFSFGILWQVDFFLGNHGNDSFLAEVLFSPMLYSSQRLPFVSIPSVRYVCVKKMWLWTVGWMYTWSVYMIKLPPT